jgi:hypothetical protein
MSLVYIASERDCVLLSDEARDLAVPKDEAESDVEVAAEEEEEEDRTLSAGFKCARHSEMCSDPGRPPRQLWWPSSLRSGCQPFFQEKELFLAEGFLALPVCSLPW